MGINLRIECFLDANPSLNPGLASLDLSHDLLDILQLVTALPEYSCGQQKKMKFTLNLSVWSDCGINYLKM